ncbi:hypothetical protein RRG08_018913 [Elysia crispata]|uniref:Uncharacterized protein n=1 Tax=Elysia crispata TaxID=231223 RepID=A0AAE1A9F5_9GAST|nr:hypothetical protein RRG08_018913 [Elysia crispata]
MISTGGGENIDDVITLLWLGEILWCPDLAFIASLVSLFLNTNICHQVRLDTLVSRFGVHCLSGFTFPQHEHLSSGSVRYSGLQIWRSLPLWFHFSSTLTSVIRLGEIPWSPDLARFASLV